MNPLGIASAVAAVCSGIFTIVSSICNIKSQQQQVNDRLNKEMEKRYGKDEA